MFFAQKLEILLFIQPDEITQAAVNRIKNIFGHKIKQVCYLNEAKRLIENNEFSMVIISDNFHRDIYQVKKFINEIKILPNLSAIICLTPRPNQIKELGLYKYLDSNNILDINPNPLCLINVIEPFLK